MLKRILGIVLLLSIAVVYIIYPYYGNVSTEVFNISKYLVGILGAWASLKLII